MFVPTDDDYVYLVEVQFRRDEDFCWRLFSEATLYAKWFRARKWRAVVIYPNRAAEQENLQGFEELLSTSLVQRIYLNELPDISRLDDAVGAFKLVVEPKGQMIETARELGLSRSRQVEFRSARFILCVLGTNLEGDSQNVERQRRN